MRKSYLLLCVSFVLCVLSSSRMSAQLKNVCSESKSKQVYKKNRATPFANALMDQYDVRFYDLTLAVENNSLFIEGNTQIDAKVTVSQMDTFCFELQANHTIDSIYYNGSSVLFVRTGDIGYVVLPASLPMNSQLSVTIYYHGTAQNTIPGASEYGFNSAYDSSYHHFTTWSLSQPYSAYDWFPCKQYLNDKADSSRVNIITSDSNKGGSNGILVGIDTLANNKIMYKWFNKHPIDYYLISIAVSDYYDYSYYSHLVSGDSVLIQNYIYNDSVSISDFQGRFIQTDSIMRFMDSLFVPYPYQDQKYGHCLVASDNTGMEHQTMTTIGPGSTFYNVIAHELSHQWFGDLVTCKTWHDIYLNEGITQYNEYLAVNYLIDTSIGSLFMNSYHTDVMNLPGGSVYNPDTTNVGRIFDSRLTYEKGAGVTHTLRYLLGDSVFYATLRTYLNTYKNSTASIQDFKTIAETVSGQNLNDFFNEWIYGEGFPTYRIKYNSTGSYVGIVLSQTASSAVTPLFTTPIQLKLLSATGDSIIKVNVTTNSDTFWMPSTKILTGVVVDPNNWVINRIGVIQKKLDLYPNGINEFSSMQQLEIWPNPIQDGMLYLHETTDNFTDVEIVDMTGQLMVKTPYKSQLDISKLPSGMYLIKLSHEKKLLKIGKITKM